MFSSIFVEKKAPPHFLRFNLDGRKMKRSDVNPFDGPVRSLRSYVSKKNWNKKTVCNKFFERKTSPAFFSLTGSLLLPGRCHLGTRHLGSGCSGSLSRHRTNRHQTSRHGTSRHRTTRTVSTRPVPRCYGVDSSSIEMSRSRDITESTRRVPTRPAPRCHGVDSSGAYLSGAGLPGAEKSVSVSPLLGGPVYIHVW